jgi:hypothetical protein
MWNDQINITIKMESTQAKLIGNNVYMERISRITTSINAANVVFKTIT